MKLRLIRTDGPDGVLMLVHGHQGTADSDRFASVSRLFVRFAWRPIQRMSGYTGVTPARDYDLRADHDRAMSVWAGAHRDKPVLITGHTHRPASCSGGMGGGGALSQNGGDAERRADEEFEHAQQRNRPAVYTLPTPCYFNAGGCCFGDGDVTGLEIADGAVRLVRWPRDDGAPRRKIPAERGLDDVLDTVAGRTTAPVIGREVVV